MAAEGLQLSLDALSLHDAHSSSAHALLISENVTALANALKHQSSGLLLTGADRATRRQIALAASPNVAFISCLRPEHDAIAKHVEEGRLLCLDDLDTDRAEGLAKGIFIRFADSPVLALAAHKKAVPASLLRAGRLENVVYVHPPRRETRQQAWRSILACLCREKVVTVNVDKKAIELADWSPGFSASDFRLVLLRFLAAEEDHGYSYEALKTIVAEHRPKGSTLELDFVNASASMAGTHAATDWGGVGGYVDVKEMLVRLCEWPVQHKETFTRLGVTPPRGVLLHGPRGCGKTRLALAFLRRLRFSNWLHVNAPDVFSKYLGESEARVRALFERARELTPCVVFIDELDAMGGGRMSDGETGGTGVERRVLGSLLTELDGVSGGDVFVLACASRMDVLDPALLRPGRLDHLVEVQRPDRKDREEILRELLRKVPVGEQGRGGGREDVKEEVVRELAEGSEGMTGAELEAVCREAAMVTMEAVEMPEFVEKKHFWVASERMPKRAGSLAVREEH